MTSTASKIRMWDERYRTDTYAYGKDPNLFFSTQLEMIVPGRLLLPGEGEGRNAVYAASRGWSVDAFDQSAFGKIKALALAGELGVEIRYRVCAMEDFPFGQDQYDAVGLIFFHLDPARRALLHRKACESLKPGGSLILEAFHKEQLNRNSGGPQSPELLFDEGALASDFESLEIRLLEKNEIMLDEGSFHRGEAAVVRFLGIKPG
jgi:hypothetical protein